MAPRNTATGIVLEYTVLPALAMGGYSYRNQVRIGVRPSGNKYMHEIDFYFQQRGTREQLRRLVVEKFLDEEPGLGSGLLTARYRCNVEQLVDGRRIYLLRPAYLKKGFDFLINVEHIKFSSGRENPKHDDILFDLRLKHEQAPIQYEHLHHAITRVYECEDPTDVLPLYPGITFSMGYS